MRLTHTPEQEQLRAAVRDLLTGTNRLRAVMDSETGHDDALWHALSRDLGVLGLAVPEDLGGSGGGYADRAVVSEELGRVLAPTALAATTRVLDALVAGAADAELVSGLVSGDSIATTAARGAVTASESGTGATPWRLTGRSDGVAWLTVADLVLVRAKGPQGPATFVVRTDDTGVTRTPMRGYDPTQRVGALTLSDAPARLIESTVDGRVRDLAAVTTAAEAVGGMGRLLEMTVEYAKNRVQFGRPIGSFQAVKHGCADMYVAVELATSLVRYAAWAADNDPAALPDAARSAQVFVSPAYVRAGTDAVQLHGGIGYTWEHDAHLYFKRARFAELQGGGTAAYRARLAATLVGAQDAE